MDIAPQGSREGFLSWVSHAWYVACLSSELGSAPLSRRILGIPFVLFRGERGRAAALLDRCGHRNAPLSIGRRVGTEIECRYHGWRYDRDGFCVQVPGLCDDQKKPGRVVPSYPTAEQDGFVWVYTQPGASPPEAPYLLPSLGEGATEIRRVVQVESPLHPTLENALDVPHTAILHGGLFRSDRARHRIRARVRRTGEGMEAEYLGEPRPAGLAARILSPSGGVVTHFDRFILPSIAQVEYRLGSEAHFMVSSLCTPIEEHRTRMHAVISFRTRLPAWIVRILLRPVARRIFRQDAFILEAQGRSIRQFGGVHYTSTPIDVLGLQMARLLRLGDASARGSIPEDRPEDWSREIELEV